MRASLVEPYWADVELTRHHQADNRNRGSQPCKRAIVAEHDGKGTVLAFDPTGGEYLLASKGDGSLSSFGVRGDAVGCFLAI